MPTSAWRFSGTEGADDAVVKLKGLAAQDLIEVQDLTVIRWPRWAAGRSGPEHVPTRAAGLFINYPWTLKLRNLSFLGSGQWTT